MTELPRTFRPRRARRVVFAIAVVLILMAIATAITMPGGAIYAYVWRVTVPVTTLIIIGFLLIMARPFARAGEDGLLVVNLLRQHHYDWPEIVAVRFARDAPWASLDIADGRNMPLMAIQNSDGAFARSEAQALADLLIERGESADG